MSEFVSRHVLEYPGGYTRSVGPVIGKFLTGLRDGRLLGVRTPSGKVVVPPTEYDPDTSEAVGRDDSDWVEAGPYATVQSWTWVRRVRPGKHPLNQPFAFALVKPDGADTAMLAAVAASGPDAMKTGMRVVPHWSVNRTGTLRDIAAWVPLPEGERITLDQAMQLFTVNGARQMGNAGRTGAIEKGLLADLVVIDRNPFKISVPDIHNTKVLQTYINGELVYEASAR